FLSLYCDSVLCLLHSFPTRRSSDLDGFLKRRGNRYQLTERDLAIVEETRDVLFPKLGEDGVSVLVVFFSFDDFGPQRFRQPGVRSEEHTSELQSRGHLVCRLLLEKK